MEWLRLNPASMEQLYIGGKKVFDVPANYMDWQEKMIERFPEEEGGLRDYFKTIMDIWWFLERYTNEDFLQLLLKPQVIPWVFRSAQDLVDTYVKDPLAKAILLIQMGDIGLAPSKAAALALGGLVGHMSQGGCYPKGGGNAIPSAFVKQFKKQGGKLKLSARVAKILMKNNHVSGIELENGESYTAKSIISNVDPRYTYSKLLGKSEVTSDIQRRLKVNEKYSLSNFSMFLATNLDLEKMGFSSGNVWIYDDKDVDGVWRDIEMRHEAVNKMIFMTIPTLKDRSKMRDDHVHTIEIFTFTGYEHWQEWENTSSDARPQEYHDFKKKMGDSILAKLEKVVPGLSANLLAREDATPLTNHHFTNSYRGSAYGIAKTPFQVGPFGYSIRSSVKGLWCVGSSTVFHGISFAAKSGMIAAGQILGKPWMELVEKPRSYMKKYDAEKSSTWPESYAKQVVEYNYPEEY